MKSPFATFFLGVTLGSTALAFPALAAPKTLIIENQSPQPVVSMSVETKVDDVLQPATNGNGNGNANGLNKLKKSKKDFAIGLGGAPKNNKKSDDEPKIAKVVEVDVDEANCLANLTFTLGDGRVIDAPKMDICYLDGVVVEEPDVVSVAVAAPLPPFEPLEDSVSEANLPP